MCMTAKRVIIIVGLAVVTIGLWVQVFRLWRENADLSAQKASIKTRMASLLSQTDQTKKDIAYYSIPTNLERVVKEKLNYVAAGEKLIIVVANQEASSTPTP